MQSSGHFSLTLLRNTQNWMILSLTSVPMEISQTANGLIQVLFSVTLNKEIVQTFFPKFPQQKLNKQNKNNKKNTSFTETSAYCYFILILEHTVYEKVKKALSSDSLRKGIQQASPSAQTDCLEGFHSVLNQFAPKIIAYSYLGMYCR